jgi:hypothetical protein
VQAGLLIVGVMLKELGFRISREVKQGAEY